MSSSILLDEEGHIKITGKDHLSTTAVSVLSIIHQFDDRAPNTFGLPSGPQAHYEIYLFAALILALLAV